MEKMEYYLGKGWLSNCALVFLASVIFLRCANDAGSNCTEKFVPCEGCESKRIKYDNGNLKYEWTVLNGARHGVERAFYKSGNKLSESSFKNGKKHGIYFMWDEKGNQLLEELWCDGKCISKCKTEK